MNYKVHLVCFLLAVFSTLILVSCDSGGGTPPEEALRFPAEGNFGPNLLSGEVDTAYAPANPGDDTVYSMRAEKVSEIDSVRLRIDMVGEKCPNPIQNECEQDFWARPISSVAGWSSKDLGPSTNEEWTLLAEKGDAQIEFGGTDTLRLRVFVGNGDGPIRTVRVPWIQK